MLQGEQFPESCTGPSPPTQVRKGSETSGEEAKPSHAAWKKFQEAARYYSAEKSFCGETDDMWGLWERLPGELQPHPASKNPHWRETFRLC